VAIAAREQRALDRRERVYRGNQLRAKVDDEVGQRLGLSAEQGRGA
jgi:hypothetical protein